MARWSFAVERSVRKYEFEKNVEQDHNGQQTFLELFL